MSEVSDVDLICMARALELARRGWGRTHPNPMVGAVVAEGGEIVSEGWHQAAGKPHAEIEAMSALAYSPASDATLYVTLEPCSSVGRTGPCTEAIIESGIRRVVVGATDPNPKHAGEGFEQLRACGIEVVCGVLEDACSDLNLIFNHWITHHRPLLAVKIAATLDGCLAARGGHSRWVTGPAARADVMLWRRLFPAIAVGAGTVLADDPRLTSRLEAEAEWCPQRFVLDSTLRSLSGEHLPALYRDSFAGRTTVVCGATAPQAARERAAQLGLEVLVLEAGSDGRPDLNQWLDHCALRGLCGVVVEPGAELLTSLLRQRLPDYWFQYTAPKLMADAEAPRLGTVRASADMGDAFALSDVRHASFDGDFLTRGMVTYPHT